MKSQSDREELKKRLAGLSPDERRSLLKKLGKKACASDAKHASKISKAEPVFVEETRDVNGDTVEIRKFKASSVQERMWFLDQFFGDQPVYSSPMAFHLQGKLNVKALQDAFNSVVARHGALRSTFESYSDGVLQCEKSKALLTLCHKNLDGTLDVKREAARAYVNQEACRPFDLENDLPIRVHLVYIDLEECVLLIVLHHIVSDGWTRANLLRELCETYKQVLKGKYSVPQPAPLQLSDYNEWQLSTLQGPVYEAHLAYWKNKLGDNIEPLNLPADFPRASGVTSSGDSMVIEIGNELIEQLREFAKAQGVTLFMLGLAAFKSLLHYHSKQTDLVVGTPIANRNRSELETMIGCFINTLAIKTKVKDETPFKDYLLQVRDACIEAYENQDVPYEQLTAQLDFDRSKNRSPIFQSIFALQDFPEVAIDIDGIYSSEWFVRTFTSKVEIYLNLEKKNGTWVSIIEYNSDLFSKERIEGLAEHWKNMLESIIDHFDQSVLQLTTDTALNSALKVKQGGIHSTEGNSRADRSELEQLLKKIIQEVLDIKSIELDHNFFESGGNSLLANLVIIKLDQKLGVKLRFQDVLEKPTIRSLADLIETILDQPAEDKPVDSNNLPSSERQEAARTNTSCYVIGSGRMLIEAVQRLLENGIVVHGIYSTDEATLKWAEESKLPFASAGQDLKVFLSTQPFDYLFSIINPTLLDDEVIKLPKKGAINFHDAPLPRYGGMNSPYWAIINREKSWAVTWHEMVGKVDAGAILKQVPVKILPEDNFLNLGLRCVQAGMTGLQELLDELLEDRVVKVEQDLNERTYFGKYKRHSVAGII